jgi:hypothetical protein
MAKFQKLAALRQFEIFNAIGKRRVPACAIDGAGEHYTESPFVKRT